MSRGVLRLLVEKVWTQPGRCPVCTERDWNVGDEIDVPLHKQPGRVYRYVPVTCRSCGHTVLFHRQLLEDAATRDTTPSDKKGETT